MKLVHPAANACPLPVHDANSANTWLPTVSRSVTRSPLVLTCVQVCPPVWVTHSSGPNAHPSCKLRNLIWLTPVAPSGPPVTGAGTPVQVPPPLSVRAIEVQYWVAQWPGVLAWPITQPVCVPMNVTEVGRKLAGTDAGSDPAGSDGRGVAADDSAWPCPVGVAEEECPAAAADVVFGLSTGRLTTWGTVTAAATITAAVVAVMASLRILRRRARRLISSKVPGGGGSGLIRSLSQSSTLSRWSAIAFPQRRLQLGARREQVRLDGALRPVQQRRDLPDPEAAVVVQQKRVAQPRRQ